VLSVAVLEMWGPQMGYRLRLVENRSIKLVICFGCYGTRGTSERWRMVIGEHE